MTPRDVADELAIVRDVLDEADLLENESHAAFAKLIAQAHAARKMGAAAEITLRWDSSNPIAIAPVEPRGRTERSICVDFYGHMTFRGGSILRATGDEMRYQLVFRVWSKRAEHLFREQYDAGSCQGLLKRVILRYRVEEAHQGASEPAYHLQIGGHTRAEDEWCHFPEDFHQPHFPHHPMSIIMAADQIVGSFFSPHHPDVREDTKWQGALLRAESCCLRPFLTAVIGGCMRGPGGAGHRGYVESLWSSATWDAVGVHDEQ